MVRITRKLAKFVPRKVSAASPPFGSLVDSDLGMASQVHYDPNFIQKQIRAADKFTLTADALRIQEDIPYRSVLALTLPVGEALDKNATNCTHMRNPQWFLLLQVFLSICENKCAVGGVGDRITIPGIDLLPLRRSRTAPAATTSRVASDASTSRFTYGISGGGGDADDSLSSLIQEVNQRAQVHAQRLGLDMDMDMESEGESGGATIDVDAGVRNPYAEVPDNMPATQFFWEVVYKDKKAAQDDLARALQEQRDTTGVNMNRDQIKAQLSKWFEGVDDQDLVQRCISSMDRLFLSKPALDAGRNSTAGVGRAFDDISAACGVDSITLWMLSSDLYDPNWFLKAALLDDLEKASLRANSLSATVRRQMMNIVAARRDAAMGVEEDGEEEGDGFGKSSKKKFGGGGRRPGGGNRGRDRVARECFSGIGISHLATLADMYTQASVSSEFVRSRKNGSRTVNSSHPLYATTLFSPVFALLNRSSDCEYAQSLLYNHENPDKAYVVGDYDERGFRHFRFPRPANVISIDSDQVIAHHLVRKTFPHIQRSSMHPLVLRAPQVFPKNLSGGVKAQHRELYQRLRERSAHESIQEEDQRLEAAVVSMVHEHYAAAHVRVDRSQCSPFTNPTDLAALDAFVTFDEEVVAADPKLGRRPVSTVQENASRCLSVAKPLAKVVRRIEGTERQRAIKLAHTAWGLERYRGTRSSRFENPDSIRALHKFVQEGGYDEAPIGLKLVDRRLGPLGNLVASLTLFNSDLMHASDPQLATLLWTAMLTSATMDFKSKINVLIAGGGGTSKSYSMDVAQEQRIGSNCITDHVAQAAGEGPSEIVSTTHEVTRNTECALQTDDAFKMDLAVLIYHELKYNMLSDPNENGSGNAFWKNILEKGYSSLLAWKADDTTGLTKTEQRINMLRVQLSAAINWDMSNIEDPVKQRFLIIYISDKSNEANNITDKMLTQNFFSGNGGPNQDLHTRATFVHLCHQMQAVVTEIEALIGGGTVTKVNENIGWLIGTFVSDYMRRQGQQGFHPRTLDRFIKYARQLCILEWFATEYLNEGGRFYQQPIRLEHLITAEAALFITPAQMILSLGTLAPFSFKQGKKEVREALLHRYSVRVSDFLENTGILKAADARTAVHVTPPALSTKQMDNLLAELCPVREYGASSSSFQPQQQQQRPQTSQWPRPPEGLRVSYSSGETAAPIVGADRAMGRANLDLNYVRFHLPKYSMAEFATTIYKWMDDSESSDTKPPAKAIRDLLEHLRTVTVSAYSMCVNPNYRPDDSAGGPLIESRSGGKKSFPVIKLTDSHELAIHLGFLMTDTTGENMIVDALKTLFNHVNEPPRPYLFGKGQGDTHTVEWFGKGFKPGTRKETDRDMSRTTNPAAFKVFHCPSFFHHDSARDLMYSGVTGSMDAEAQDMTFGKNIEKAHRRWTSAEMMIVDTSLERLGQCIRNREIYMTKGPITCEDIDVACDLFSKWCAGIYTTPGDMARFGGRHETPSSRILEIDYDLLEKRNATEPWSIDACEDVTLTGYSDDGEESPPATFSGALAKGKGKGKGKSKAVPLPHACESFGSIDELTQHLVGDDSGTNYAEVIRDKLSRDGRAVVLPEDIVYDVDMPPQQFMVHNIHYREDEPVHPLCNPEYVPLWCLLGMERWKFKDLLYSRSMSEARHAASNTRSLDDGRKYPDFILKDHFRTMDMKRRQRKGQAQRGTKTATVTSNIASGFVRPDDAETRQVNAMATVLYEQRVAEQRLIRCEKNRKAQEKVATKKKSAPKRKKKRAGGPDSVRNVFAAHRKSRKTDFAAQIARMREEEMQES